LTNCFFCCLYVDAESSSFPFDILLFRVILVVVVVVVCTSEFVVNKSSLLFSFCGRFDTVQGNDVEWLFNCVWELRSVELEDREFNDENGGEDDG